MNGWMASCVHYTISSRDVLWRIVFSSVHGQLDYKAARRENTVKGLLRCMTSNTDGDDCREESPS